MAEPKFKLGQEVIIQPTRQSQPLRGVVTHVQWNESFKEFGYTVTLHSHSGMSTAWESEIRAAVR